MTDETNKPLGSSSHETPDEPQDLALHHKLTKAISSLRWYMSEVLGGDAYQKYLRHHNEHHPEEPLMGQKEFWDKYWKDKDENPGARCC